MKVKELYDAVALLGFENEIDEEATFYPALNTALHDIFRMVPVKRRGLLAHYPPNALVADTDKVIHSNGALSFKAEGAKAFYIEVSGIGKIKFSSEGKSISGLSEITFDLPHGYEVKRGFLRNNDGIFPTETEITVTAESMCRIRAIGIYGEITSANTEDIPAPNGDVVYSLGRIFPDFSTLAEQPKWEGGSTLTKYYVEGEKLSVPQDCNGDIEIVYIPKIHEYIADDKDGDLDIKDEYIGALKLLVASYVWLDDNADRAQYYKGLYNEEIALISAKHRDLNPIAYESVNNW